jgi:hypothetical protein
MRPPKNPKDKTGGPLAEDTEIDPNLLEEDNPGSRKNKIQGIPGDSEGQIESPLLKDVPKTWDRVGTKERETLSNPNQANEFGPETLVDGIIPMFINLAAGLATNTPGMGGEIGYNVDGWNSSVITPWGNQRTTGADTEANGDGLANVLTGAGQAIEAGGMQDAANTEQASRKAAADNLQQATREKNLGAAAGGVATNAGASGEVSAQIPGQRADAENQQADAEAGRQRTAADQDRAKAQEAINKQTKDAVGNVAVGATNLLTGGKPLFGENGAINTAFKNAEGFFSQQDNERAEEMKNALPVSNRITEYKREPNSRSEAKSDASPRTLQASVPKSETRDARGMAERPTMVDYTETIRAEEEEKRRRAERNKRFGG